MKRTKKFLALLLALLLLATAFVGCRKEEEEEPEDDHTTKKDVTTTDTNTDIPQNSDIPIVSKGAPVITLVRPDNASQAEIDAMVLISKTLESACKKMPKQATDFNKTGEYDSSSFEILVGATAYSETKAAMQTIAYGEYTVAVVGHKLIVFSYLDDGIIAAANSLCNFIKASLVQNSSELAFTPQSNAVRIFNKNLNPLPVYTAKSPSVTDKSGASAYQLVYDKITLDEYNNYLKTYEGAGYELVFSRTAGTNHFNTYKNGTNAVTTYYMEHTSRMRLIVEPESNLFITGENKYTPTVTPILSMIGDFFGENGQQVGGLMAFVIRLSDGRFLVIDGGVATENGYGEKIYRTMVEQSGGNPNVTVAGWFFSHGHTDHVGGFRALAKRYFRNVTVENFFYTFISTEDAEKIENGGNVYQMQQTEYYISTYYPNAKVYKPHTGQRFELADATIEYFYTPDDYIQKGRTFGNGSTNNFNLTSTIFSVDIGGQRIMFLGDSQVIANNETAAMYGSLLKSDIVQVAHHGGLGGTPAIYRAIDASVALFTTDDNRVESYIQNSEANKCLVYDLHLKEYYNAHNRVYTFELPYTPKGSGLMP